jgi:hypothetical protein
VSASFAVPPSALPGISPTRGESGRRYASHLICDVKIWASGHGELLSPLVGEMPGRAEGGKPQPERAT